MFSIQVNSTFPLSKESRDYIDNVSMDCDSLADQLNKARVGDCIFITFMKCPDAVLPKTAKKPFKKSTKGLRHANAR
jgi:hypothetical protein